jgi:hypothetical protein
MLEPGETRDDGSLSVPPRPEAEVLVPRLRPNDLRRELRRLQEERESALRELGGLVVEMARQGRFVVTLVADRAAVVRALQNQIDVLEGVVDGKGKA